VRNAVLNLFLLLSLVFCSVHTPALAHDHDDHDEAASLFHVDSDEPKSSDVVLGVSPAHDHAPTGLQVENAAFDNDAMRARSLIHPRSQPVLSSWMAEPPDEPPSA